MAVLGYTNKQGYKSLYKKKICKGGNIPWFIQSPQNVHTLVCMGAEAPFYLESFKHIILGRRIRIDSHNKI